MDAMQLRPMTRFVSLGVLLVALSASTACRESLAPEDLAGADLAGDLAGADLSGVPQGDMAGPVVLTPTNDVTIIVEPGDNGDALVAAISGAATSVHMTMYILTSQRIIDALIERKNAGKDVKVLLNKTFPMGAGSNTSVYGQLLNAGVDVKYGPSMYTYTHQKTILVDTKAAWIMTLNASASAFTDNREFVANDTDTADVAEAEAVFQADWTGAVTATNGKLITAPDNAEPKLLALIDRSKTSIDLEGEVFSSDSILQAIGRAKKRGVMVRIVLSDETPTTAQATAVQGMKQVGIPVRVCKLPFIHSKAIVADSTLAYVGSVNFTANSLRNNREMGVLVGKKSEVDKVAAAIAADFAAGTDQ